MGVVGWSSTGKVELPQSIPGEGKGDAVGPPTGDWTERPPMTEDSNSSVDKFAATGERVRSDEWTGDDAALMKDSSGTRRVPAVLVLDVP